MTDAFAALLDEPRWLAWREEERGGKKTKVPFAVRRQSLGGATDPAPGERMPRPKGAAEDCRTASKTGCGIALGDIGDHIYLAGVDLAGVDLDSSIDENSAPAPWAVRIISLLGNYSEVSPSRRGLKAFFYIADDDVRWFLDQIGVTPRS
jgi:hypothetical protein